MLVLFAHPDLRASRVNRALLQGLRRLREAWGPDRLDIRDLYALYPDFHIDVDAEQAALARADLIVWVHPVHWYSMPALMKLWVDEVFTHGWAYGHGGTALQGKRLWLVASTGGTASAYQAEGYNRYPFEAFLPAYDQTAALCGLQWLPPVVRHGALTLDDADIGRHVDTVLAALDAHACASTKAAPSAECRVPPADRPSREP